MEGKDAKLVWESFDAILSGDVKRINEMTDKLKKRNDELAAEKNGDGMKTNAYTNEDMLSAMREYVIYRAKNRLIADRDIQIVETLLDYETRTEEMASDERKTEVMCLGGGSHGD